MPGRVLVDSSFIIDRLRSGFDPLEELAEFSDEWELLTCGVVQVEILRGMKQQRAYDRMAEYLGCMMFVPTHPAIWERVTKLAWKLDREGKAMQVTDLIIAASAIEAEAAVLTFDSDFSRVPGLQVVQTLA